MLKRLNRPTRILLITCAVLVGIVTAVQIVLESQVVEKTVNKYAAEYIDGNLSFSDIGISVLGAFPKLRVRVDSLCLTYPHDRFPDAQFADSLCLAGRGAVSDTLLSFDRLSMTLAPFRLLYGRLFVKHFAIHGLSAYVHSYPDSTANWQIFRIPSDTSRNDTGFMPVVVKDFIIDRHPDIVYTDQTRDIYTDLGLNSLSFSGTISSDGGLSVKGASLGFDAYSIASVGKIRNISLPVQMEAKASVVQSGDSLNLRIPSFNATVAHVPLSFSGKVKMFPDRSFVSGKGSIDSLRIGTILRQYGSAVSPLAPYFTTDSRLNLSFKAHGWYQDGKLPEIKAKLSIPESKLCYVPRDMNGRVALECNLSSAGDKLDAMFDRLFLEVPGVSVTMTGFVNDILSGNPSIKANVTANTVMDYLTKYFLHDGGIDAFGKVDFALSANARLSEFQSMNFDNATMNGRISANRLQILFPYSNFKLNAYRTGINISSNPMGLGMGVLVDSAYCYAGLSGKDLAVRLKKCSMLVDMSTVNVYDSYVPRSVVSISARNAFVRSDELKAMLNGTDLYLNCRKKLDMIRPAVPDSLKRVEFADKLPPLDSTGRPVPPKDDRLVKIRLDSLLIAEMMKWNTEGNVRVDNGFVAAPVFPLKSSIGGIRMVFNDNNVKIDTLSLRAGTSDIQLKGEINGIRRYAKHKGNLNLDMDVRSKRLNINEIVSALNDDKRVKASTSNVPEVDENFEAENPVNRTRKSSQKAAGKSTFMLPPHIHGKVNIGLSQVNYLNIDISPISAQLNLSDRCLQLKDFHADMGFAKFGATAYYSTRSEKDITVGLDATAKDVQINPVMRLFPQYESFAPIAKSIDGVIGLDACVIAGLDSKMNVKPSTISAVSRIDGSDIYINDVGSLRKLTRLLFFKNQNIGHIDDFHIDAMVQSGKLEVFPFIITADKYKVALQGIQGLDGTMNYYASVLKSPFLIPFGVKVYGNFDKCKVGLGVPKYMKNGVPQFTAQMDSMQLNISKAIREIYKDGLKQVRKYNQMSNKNLLTYKRHIGFDSGANSEALSKMNSDKLTSQGKVAGVSGKSSERLDTNLIKEEFKRIREEFKQRKKQRKDGKH